MSKPLYTIEIERDYDGWFTAEVRGAVEEKLRRGLPLKHSRFIVSAGPWRSYDHKWEECKTDPKALEIDFYSVGRHDGRGSIDWNPAADDETALFHVL